jgi:hypothetical protein
MLQLGRLVETPDARRAVGGGDPAAMALAGRLAADRGQRRAEGQGSVSDSMPSKPEAVRRLLAAALPHEPDEEVPPGF